MRVDAEPVEHLQDVRRCGRRTSSPWPALAQERGLLGRPHLRRVRPRGVQDRPAASGRSCGRRPRRGRRCSRRPTRGRPGRTRAGRPSRGGCRRPRGPPRSARSVTALMHAFSPGTSPPPVRMPIFIGATSAQSSKNTSATRVRAPRGPAGPSRPRRAARRRCRSPCSATIRPHPPRAPRGRPPPAPNRVARIRSAATGRPAALDVTEHRHPRLPAGPLLELGADVVRDARRSGRSRAGRAGTRAAASCPRPASRPRRRRRSRTSARAGAGAGARAADLVEVERALGDQDRVGAARRSPTSSAIHPALRPITSTTMRRSWLSAVVWSRSIASVATCTAVANPMHASVPDEVVVDRLRDADHRHALGDMCGRGAQRPLAADRDQAVDARGPRTCARTPLDALLVVRVRARGARGSSRRGAGSPARTSA